MHFTAPALATLAALSGITTAVDIRNFFETGCRGGYFHFRDINSRVCALAIRDNGTRGCPSARFDFVSPNNQRAIGWQGDPRGPNRCHVARTNQSVGRNRQTCIQINPSIGQYAGTSWAGANLKRDEVMEPCTERALPTAVVLNDGHLYNTEGMEQEELEVLMDLAVEGTESGDLPEFYAKFEGDVEGVERRWLEIQG
ncbi:hypothetical protein BS50DRAFT_591254 [Corynespora cassiicola Philippines]|uniref:Ecp2 effector protein domain-containing protein n=1 Tax=Corynespora cassiicola Philippines TaxID=1448308 RepID=A0A2T2NC57_CORCC|nr:hypothetical protein BS50DRAFT_591254 [Corynespora cassiicola Philippines]